VSLRRRHVVELPLDNRSGIGSESTHVGATAAAAACDRLLFALSIASRGSRMSRFPNLTTPLAVDDINWPVRSTPDSGAVSRAEPITREMRRRCRASPCPHPCSFATQPMRFATIAWARCCQLGPLAAERCLQASQSHPPPARIEWARGPKTDSPRKEWTSPMSTQKAGRYVQEVPTPAVREDEGGPSEPFL